MAAPSPARARGTTRARRARGVPASSRLAQFTVDELLSATAGELAHPHAGARTAGPVATDTRKDTRGAWFVALAGPNFDGTKFAAKARDGGCIGVVAPAPPPDDWHGAAWVTTPTTGREALGALGRAVRRRAACPVVAITGSAGKTTTRTLTALVMSTRGRAHATEGNLNNDVGVPTTLLATPDDATSIVLEMGMSAPGEIAALAAIGEPDVRVVTNVALAHAATCGGTLQSVAACKAELVETARRGDVVVLNADDPHVARMAECADSRGAVVWWFGRDCASTSSRQFAVTWSEPELDQAGFAQRFRLKLGHDTAEVRLDAPGAHLAANAAAAAAAGAAVGVPLARAAAALSAYVPPPQRLAPRALANGVVLLDDVYNANPTSVRAALSTARSIADATIPRRRLVVLLGDMRELGPGEGRAHEDALRAAFAAMQPGDAIGVSGTRFASALERVDVPSGVKALSAHDGASLGRAAAPLLTCPAVLLAKGSRGSRMEDALHAIETMLPPEM